MFISLRIWHTLSSPSMQVIQMANKVNNTKMSNVLNVTLFKLAVLNKTHTIFKSKI